MSSIIKFRPRLANKQPQYDCIEDVTIDVVVDRDVISLKLSGVEDGITLIELDPDIAGDLVYDIIKAIDKIKKNTHRTPVI